MEISELTLAKAVDVAESVRCARAAAASTAPGARGSSGDSVFKMQQREPRGAAGPGKEQCTVCGRRSHKASECRFASFKCTKCKAKGHLRRMCKYVNFVGTEETCEGDDDDDVLTG
ncbi:uncharacterized protein LOC125488882 [Plutella xylostella]|nr:uncharacterized protein LOC125488882 [Plutella xylostella]